MSDSARTPFAAPGRFVGGLRDRRVWWLTACDVAIEIGERIAEGGVLSKAETFDLVGLVMRARETPFPLSYASAQAAAGGFRELGRGVVEANGELKVALAQAFAAAGRCCRQLLELETQEQAAAQRRRYGED